MNAKDVIRSAMNASRMLTSMLLDDLSDADLMQRPVPAANHVAWQLGHLISSEHSLVERCCPGSMPTLPEAFAAAYTTETAKSDEPTSFHTKEEYQKLYNEQREGTLRILDELPEERLDATAPEGFPPMTSTVGDVFLLCSTHELMHIGQYAVLRRQLGKPVLA